ncbi:hypothetical protein Tsubulata_022915 [Turnera subulata]|uniref:F-box domain-containing protein n=1 Tax=Turnera subulata TaxID=218843 RepID=A0A9Q0JE48_9ROSI|nr:hypothetical protein Tsubulata_022915 [Turnera subulata]
MDIMASTGGCPTISDIPVEILEQIIKRAAVAVDFLELLNCRKVCRLWRSLFVDLSPWQHLFLSDPFEVIAPFTGT